MVVYLEVVGRALRLVQDLSEHGVEAVGFVKPVEVDCGREEGTRVKDGAVPMGVEAGRAASCWRAATMDVPGPLAGLEPVPVVQGNGLMAVIEDEPAQGAARGAARA